MDDFKPTEHYDLRRTLEIPAHISCLELVPQADHLYVGSEDGCLRVYDLSSFKVIKAIRGLNTEVSSIVCLERPNSEFQDVWLASGKRVLNFRMDLPKMIQTMEDAMEDVALGESGEDVLNELSLNAKKSHLAFCMDSGVVGVVDLSTKVVSRMKTRHENVCGSVKFIPDRPREIVSGGYDTELLHFDYLQGTVLSSRKMPTYVHADGLALAPPFIMSTAISPTGILAAGTADGRLWLGYGGRKRPSSKVSGMKKSRKWRGLNEEELIIKIAEGPLVAMAFDDTGTLIIATLLGVMSRYILVSDEKEASIKLNKIWQEQTRSVEKVNALTVDRKRIVVGGLTAGGRGIFEIWKRLDQDVS